MKDKEKITRYLLYIMLLSAFLIWAFVFESQFLDVATKVALVGVRSILPQGQCESFYGTTSQHQSAAPETTAPTTQPITEETKAVLSNVTEDFTKTPDDILKIVKKAQSTASKDKKDGSIKEKQYINDGVTDKYGKVRMKNVNKTQVNLKEILNEKIDLSVTKDEPSVLIYHTHTTETYHLLERDFYPVGWATRSNDKGRNMVRVGEEICRELEKAGYKVIHDKEIHDAKYTGAYAKSRKSIESYLKKYPSIQITLDIHRDAIQLTDGTKIKPVAEIKGKKAAQIMIIAGCQEEGGPVTNLPDWRYNLTFAVHLQNKLEELFGGITRPLYFCPRSYNMNVTHCSLLVEVGSDSNTLQEAVYTGKCIGTALAEIMKDYEE